MLTKLEVFGALNFLVSGFTENLVVKKCINITTKNLSYGQENIC